MLVVVILWRPSANNQRYAYSPLTDGIDETDEEEEQEILTQSGISDTTTKREKPGIKKLHKQPKEETAEDDLKWIEENIPQTIADGALPVVLDDGEDEADSKYQMSKME